MAGIFYSPPRNVETMTKSRNAAYKLKNGSPKFRDILRERCRARVKENRGKFLNILRNSSNHEFQKVLTDTIRQELIEFCEDKHASIFEITSADGIDEALITLEQMKEENLKDEVEQIMQNYDALMANDELLFASMLEEEMEDLLECPVCLGGYIVLSPTRIICSQCDIYVPAHISLNELSCRIKFNIATHGNNCPARLQFTTAKNCGRMSIDVMCSLCSYANEIV